MYTVKQAAALTGIPQATLRAWERRYGIVRPSRSEGGYRLYDEAQIAVLRAMARLVSQGVPASAAAVHARNGSRPEEAAIQGGSLVDAARTLDSDRFGHLLEDVLSAGPFEQSVDTWLLPQLRLLGDAWSEDAVTVAQEHFASAQVMRAIAAVFEAAVVGPEAVSVLVGLPPGGHHQIGVFSFAACLRRLGVDVIYLGADVPVDEWVVAAAGRDTRGVVIGVNMADEVAAAQAIVDSFPEAIPPVTVWVGGSQRHGVLGATLLPDAVVEAARIVQESLVAGVA